MQGQNWLRVATSMQFPSQLANEGVKPLMCGCSERSFMPVCNRCAVIVPTFCQKTVEYRHGQHGRQEHTDHLHSQHASTTLHMFTRARMHACSPASKGRQMK